MGYFARDPFRGNRDSEFSRRASRGPDPQGPTWVKVLIGVIFYGAMIGFGIYLLHTQAVW